MSVAFREEPERPTRGRLSPLRDRAVVRAAVVGVIVGLAGGFFGFWVASSRGLDNVDLGNLVAAGTTLLAIVLIALAAARALSHDDYRLGAALVLAVAAVMVGSSIAFAVLPGDTTDGTLELTVGSAPRDEPAVPPVPQAAKCTWDRARASVSAIASRRQLVAVPHVAVTVAVDIAADGSAALTLDALAPVTFEPVVRFTGSGAPALEDPSGRIGQLAVTDLTRQELPGGDVDPAIAEFLIGELQAVGAGESARMAWECPQLP